jgi:hypothetical protein
MKLIKTVFGIEGGGNGQIGLEFFDITGACQKKGETANP